MSIKIIQFATKSLFFAGVFTTAYVVLLGTVLLHRDSTYKTRIYPHVYANTANFGGKEQADVLAYYQKINEGLSRVVITIEYKDVIATYSGQTLGLRYDASTIATQLYDIGRSQNWPTRMVQKATTLLGLGSYRLSYKPGYQFEPINEQLELLSTAYNKEPKDALFDLKDGRVSAFRVEEDGVELNTKQAIQTFEDSLLHVTESNIPQHIQIVVEAKAIKPKITLGEANNFGILEKIGEGASNYKGSSAERIHNLSLAATKFHGVLIPPGDVLSYNKTVGDISVATGYKTAYVIKNGRTVLGDGGGVCQDSTTLFRAALNTGLPIVERKGHAYRVKYYENDRKPGFDATVYAPSVDFKFKNDTPAHILIQVDNNRATQTLTFSFYGKHDGRRVELSDAKVYGHTPAPAPLYEETPTLPRGVTKQVDWAAPGAKSEFTYKVYAASGELLQDKVFYTAYRPWQAVFLVGTGE
ncbi:MAG: Vancomycin B-type resistance protein VanW [Microgenomates bacterium OLB23]|nr:MAG: Vancomycin B-type resistance protein VanW [Microgenomates bacterium OLB23]